MPGYSASYHPMAKLAIGGAASGFVRGALDADDVSVYTNARPWAHSIRAAESQRSTHRQLERRWTRRSRQLAPTTSRYVATPTARTPNALVAERLGGEFGLGLDTYTAGVWSPLWRGIQGRGVFSINGVHPGRNCPSSTTSERYRPVRRPRRGVVETRRRLRRIALAGRLTSITHSSACRPV
jgi:hypothetical protein